MSKSDFGSQRRENLEMRLGKAGLGQSHLLILFRRIGIAPVGQLMGFCSGLCLIGNLPVVLAADVASKEGSKIKMEEGAGKTVPTAKEVKVVAEKPVEKAVFLPDVQGTQINAGKKTSAVHLSELPPVTNNNYRQALVKTPGLLLSEETTPLLSIGYRGLSPDRVQFTQVMKDGIPIHADMFGYPESYYTPILQSVDHIEFIRGGAALMYGPQPGGALNYVTKMPATDTKFLTHSENAFGSDGYFSTYEAATGTVGPLVPPPAWQKRSSEARALVNSANFPPPSGGGQAGGGMGYYGYFHERQGDGFRDGNSDYQVQSGGVKVTVNQTGKTRFIGTYDEYHEEHGEPGGLALATTVNPAYGQRREFTTRPNDRFRLERYVGTLTVEHEFSAATQLDFKTYGGHYRRYSKRQRGGGFGAVPVGAASATNDIQEQDFYNLGFEPRLRHDYEFFGETHTLSAGTHTFFSHSPKEDQRGTSPASDSGALLQRSVRDSWYASAFLENLFRIWRFRVTPGVRLEHLWQHLDEELNTNKTVVPLADEVAFDFVPLFGLGVAFDIVKGIEAYTNISQSWRPKTFAQAVPTGANQIVNEDLEEGSGVQYDFGLRGNPTSFMNWDMSYFILQFDDQIGTAGDEIRNVGDAFHQGMEFAGEIDLVDAIDSLAKSNYADRVGSVAPFFTITLLDAEFTDGPSEGRQPQFAPQYNMRFGGTYKWRDRAKIGVTSTFLDDHFADDVGTLTRIVPSYKVWDLTGEIVLLKNVAKAFDLVLFGGVYNLFDENYYARITSAGIDPGYPRNLFGGIKVQLGSVPQVPGLWGLVAKKGLALGGPTPVGPTPEGKGYVLGSNIN